ncbi:MAG: DUF2855 family protein [Rubrivivax sp.]|nr:DUF2855 family protein [Rubrivivax sp.]
MHDDTGQRLLIARQDLHQTRWAPDPDAPAARPLAEGEARLRVAQAALTANNITYAAFGEAMHYWQFFPAAAADRAAWGCLPVWGYATVTESRCEGVVVGRRVWGYFPLGTHLVVQPGRVRPHGFVDAAAHRSALAAAYQQYAFTDAEPGWKPELEGLTAVLRPLFFTGFLIDDFLADNRNFGAQQLLLSSASSKTAFGTAFCLSRRRSQPGAAQVVGLTSARNQAFAQSLGVYDEVRPYDGVTALDPAVPTVYVDFAGDAAVRHGVHTHFGDALRFSSSIGGTHWEALGSGRGLPGPRPTLFFAPAQIKRRSAPPPEGWGPDGLAGRLGASWAAFIAAAQQADEPWVHIVHHCGPIAVLQAYQAMLAGQVDAREGLMLVL